MITDPFAVKLLLDEMLSPVPSGDPFNPPSTSHLMVSDCYMQRWDQLNDRQLVVLRRIGAGTDPVTAKNPDLAKTVRALHGRGLVAMPRQDGIWTAEITEAGQFYLEHGHHPDKPQAKPAAKPPAPPVPSQRLPDDKDIRAAVLIDRLRQEGGTLRIPDPDDETRRQYRSTISLAKRRGLVPAGHHLLHTGRDTGDVIIRLERDAERDETDWNRIRLEARDIVTDPHLVTAGLTEDRYTVDVPEQLLPRALGLAEALSERLRRYRGYKLGFSRRRRPPGLFIYARGCQFPVRITETDVDSGRLKITVEVSPDGTARSWSDDQHSPVEDTVSAMAEDFEPVAVAAEQRRIARERAEAEQDERWRREDEAREREWKTAVSGARREARLKYRQGTFADAFDDWHAAQRIRDFCSALERAAAKADGKQATTITRWVTWGRAQADRIDPATTLAVLGTADFTFNPGPDDLRPFLDGWSPEEPEREWRPPTEHHAEPQAEPPPWNPRRNQWWLRQPRTR